jgi:hypothetical protein
VQGARKALSSGSLVCVFAEVHAMEYSNCHLQESSKSKQQQRLRRGAGSECLNTS